MLEDVENQVIFKRSNRLRKSLVPNCGLEVRRYCPPESGLLKSPLTRKASLQQGLLDPLSANPRRNCLTSAVRAQDRLQVPVLPI